jgi:hypothetical protein
VIPVYILDRTPGATETVAWADICHGNKPCAVINYEPRRDISRWVSVDRKRPFAVYWGNRLISPVSRHATLAAATSAAHDLIRVMRNTS